MKTTAFIATILSVALTATAAPGASKIRTGGGSSGGTTTINECDNGGTQHCCDPNQILGFHACIAKKDSSNCDEQNQQLCCIGNNDTNNQGGGLFNSGDCSPTTININF